MRIFFLTCFLLFAFSLRMTAQEIFIKTGINSTTYDFRSSDGTKLLDFSSGMGNSIEMGMGFPFVPKTKKEGAPEKERSYAPNWFKNEVSLNLDSFNSFGGIKTTITVGKRPTGGLPIPFHFWRISVKWNLGFVGM